ncbi:MAG: cytochrome c3 family protein [Desulfatirhabdiaceae bacterium]
MMKSSWLVPCLAVGLMVSVAAGANPNTGAKDISLNGGSQGKVPFPHHQHQAAITDCNACHAVFPQKAGAIDELKAGGALQKKQVMNRQCVKCHKESKEANRKTGPLTCDQCHVK